MDSIAKKIDSAIASRDFTSLATIVSSPAWQSLGGGEQRSIAAYFVKAIVQNAPTLLPAAFQHAPCLHAMETALGNLPTNPVENAADNTLRQLLFECYVKHEDYVGGAKILATTRMDDDPNSVYYLTASDKCDGKDE